MGFVRGALTPAGDIRGGEYPVICAHALNNSAKNSSTKNSSTKNAQS